MSKEFQDQVRKILHEAGKTAAIKFIWENTEMNLSESVKAFRCIPHKYFIIIP